jgi:hypothetical protein
MLRVSLLAFAAAYLTGGVAQAQQSIGVVGVETGRATAGDADAAQRAIVALGTAAGGNRSWSVVEGAVGAARACADAACLGTLGRGHAHAYLLVLTVDRTATTGVPWTVSARMVDAGADRDMGMAQVEVPAGTTDWASVLGPGLEPLVRQLPAAPAPSGTLLVTSNVAGAEVFVDGSRIATIPMEPANLAVGPRSLRVRADRHSDFVQDVRIEPAQELRVDATLAGLAPAPDPPDTRPFYRRPWVWGVAGGVVLTGVVVAIVIATSGGEESTVEDGAVPIPPLR